MKRSLICLEIIIGLFVATGIMMIGYGCGAGYHSIDSTFTTLEEFGHTVESMSKDRITGLMLRINGDIMFGTSYIYLGMIILVIALALNIIVDKSKLAVKYEKLKEENTRLGNRLRERTTAIEKRLLAKYHIKKVR